MKNTKSDAMASIPNHKVLLFGSNLFNGYGSRLGSQSNADIEVIEFPNVSSSYRRLNRLADYNLVVTDYAPFESQKLYTEEQDIFDKLITEALDSATTICFVHYDEVIPRFDKHGYQFMNNEDYNRLKHSQLGFRILDRLSIQPYRLSTPIVNATIRRGVFQPFLSKWGASYNCFMAYGDGKFDDIIADIRNLSIGFTIESGRGRIIFLPFQRDFARAPDLLKGIYTLVDCLLTGVGCQ